AAVLVYHSTSFAVGSGRQGCCRAGGAKTERPSHTLRRFTQPKCIRLTERRGEGSSDNNLAVPDGEFLSIVGPSGCGKSTFLNLVAGLLPCSAGTITIGGKVVT